MKAILLFPGQGAQKVGMGADVLQQFEVARARFAAAGDILGRDIRSLCLEGPEDELKETQNTQPALFTLEAALVDVLRQRGIEPICTAGHSLGEYAALYAAGAFSFEEGLRLVARRGALMAEAGMSQPGAMAAVIGLTVEKIREVLSSVTQGVVVPANLNTPEQTVISGHVAAVQEACELLKGAGAKRAIMLPVSGAFHSPLMQPAAAAFKQVLEEVIFSAPACPVVANVTASPQSDPSRLRGLLVDQLVSPVRWVESVAALQAFPRETICLEVGPGAVLKGLIKSCAPELAVVSCGSAENVYSVTSSDTQQ